MSNDAIVAASFDRCLSDSEVLNVLDCMRRGDADELPDPSSTWRGDVPRDEQLKDSSALSSVVRQAYRDLVPVGGITLVCADGTIRRDHILGLCEFRCNPGIEGHGWHLVKAENDGLSWQSVYVCVWCRRKRIEWLDPKCPACGQQVRGTAAFELESSDGPRLVKEAFDMLWTGSLEPAVRFVVSDFLGEHERRDVVNAVVDDIRWMLADSVEFHHRWATACRQGLEDLVDFVRSVASSNVRHLSVLARQRLLGGGS